MALFSRLKKPNPEKEEELRNEIEAEGGLEKNDFPAMILGAMLVIMPAALIALGVICLIIWLLI